MRSLVTQWELEQEDNLCYVAATWANELVSVPVKKEKVEA